MSNNQDTQAKVKVVAVDDEALNLEIYRELFEGDEYDYQDYQTGDAAFEKFSDDMPDVMLLDIMMPGRNGYDICAAIREQYPKAVTKIIMVSGKSLRTERLEGYCVGADDYMTKPFDHEEIRAKVKVYGCLALTEKRLRTLNQNLEARVNSQAERLMRSEKMAALGQLAAGMAHEINNPIGFVASNLVAIKEYVETYKNIFEKQFELISVLSEVIKENHAEAYADILSMVERADLDFIADDLTHIFPESQQGLTRVRDIIQCLRTFTSFNDVSPSSLNVNDCLASAIKNTKSAAQAGLSLQQSLSDMSAITGHPEALTTAFENIIVNAMQAMPEGGTLTVASKHVESSLHIRIADTGIGIEASAQQQIFNPFFTTRDVGAGVGLGLTVANGVIHNHGGHIEFESTPGEGTCFTCVLPLQ